MRVESQVHMPSTTCCQSDDLRIQARCRGNTGPAARFRETLRLMSVEASATDSPSAENKIQNRREAAPAPAQAPNAVVEALIHTPLGTFDANSRVNNLVVDVAADSSAEAYFITHAPAEWKDNPEAVNKFTELYGAQAAAVLEYFGTVPMNIDPVWLSTTEQMARIDGEGSFLLSLQDYYHMTDEMAATAGFYDLFPGIETDLPFIPSSQPFMAPAELADVAPALLANLHAAAPATQHSTNALHRGA